MKVLQIGNTDKVGSRFNGYDLQKQLNRSGIFTQLSVFKKESDDPNVWEMGNIPLKLLNYFPTRIQNRLSLQSLLNFTPLTLPIYKSFRKADIIHFHLIHTGYFSLLGLPFLSKIKPTVWTLHDPWALTGHCIYPFDCKRWEIGCGNCLDLKTLFPMRKDRTALMFKIKKFLYYSSDIDIILASKYMYNMAKKSPLLSKFRLNHISFGLDLKKFQPTNSNKAKESIGIKADDIVITFRSIDSDYKGLFYIKKCLHTLQVSSKITLLTFNTKGLLNDLKNKYNIIEYGWENNEERIIEAYNATDIFLMPSIKETFGMMAMEAMACGVPVIVFDGTSLPEVICANEGGGIVVPQKDVAALTLAVEMLINNPEQRKTIGQKALKLAKIKYDINNHINKILKLYREVIKRRK